MCIRDSMYTAGPDGYCGDEDNGQTSAWYVFSALAVSYTHLDVYKRQLASYVGLYEHMLRGIVV